MKMEKICWINTSDYAQYYNTLPKQKGDSMTSLQNTNRKTKKFGKKSVGKDLKGQKKKPQFWN